VGESWWDVGVITVLFTWADLASTRFAISPLWETVSSRWALHAPERCPHHKPWVHRARAANHRPGFADQARLLDAFITDGRWIPDFLTPPPTSPLAGIDEELDRVLATPPEVVSADIEATAAKLPLTPLARRIAADPAPWVRQLTDALRRWYDLAVKPDWPRMRALLESDIAFRAKTFADFGPGRLFESIHPSLSWHGTELRQEFSGHQRLELRGDGMPLFPSIFLSGKPALTVRPESSVCMAYAARAIGTLWETGRAVRRDSALSALVGPTRARLMAMLEAPGSTTQLALRTGLTPAAVSRHLLVLHHADLASRHRQGKEVFYVLTDLGRQLLAH
jgi:hypothetical protein